MYKKILICFKIIAGYRGLKLLPTFLANFGYPYNDLVICKDSTDYLTNRQDSFTNIIYVICRLLIFNDYLYSITQFNLLSSMDHISFTSTLIDIRHENFPEFRNFSDLRGHSRGNPRSGLIFMGGGVLVWSTLTY